VTGKTIPLEGLKLSTLRPENVPVIELYAESALDDGTRAVEYQVQIDEGFWRPFQRSRFITVRDDWMRVQGRHIVRVRSRVAGDPYSLDDIPAEAEVVVDAEPPRVTLAEAGEGQVRIDARDRVASDVLVRYRLDRGSRPGPWSDWTPAARLAPVAVGDADQIAVEAADGEGNVGTAAQPLVRGRFDGIAGSSCGCRAAGADASPGGALFLVGVSIAGIGARLFRSRRARSRERQGENGSRKAGGKAARQLISGLGVIALSSTWAGCHCGGNEKTAATGGGGGPTTCANCTELQPGLIGEYSSAAVTGSNVWVAGYSEADWDNGVQYGDLVAGKWDGTKVSWTQVDGVPDMPPVDPTQYDTKGFRGGQIAPGDDVGLWTSIAIGADTNPAIAYFDRTHQALKFAQYDGERWSVQTVESVPSGVAGRYAKMLFLGNAFVIAYQSIAPGGKNGALVSKVRLATSSGPKPAAGSWTFEDAAMVDTTPCRKSFCASTEACVSTTKVCTATLAASQCSPACPSGQACVDSMGPACLPIWDDSKIDSYPDAIGDYVSMAPDGQGGVGIAYYDRTHGNLMIARKKSGAWATTLVDGEGATAPGTGGDAGVGASLFIDANGDWHITYVNGYSEGLQYVKVQQVTTVGKPEVVDDGLGIAGTPFDDGQHLVGDDSHLTVIAGGEVHVTYQDATVGTLHYAVGSPGSTGHTWSVKAVTQDGFAGAFSGIVVVSGQTQLMNWWRVGGKKTQGDVRFVTPP
jgi:hypothetical protein